MAHSREEEVQLLGNTQVEYKTDYAPEILEAFENRHPHRNYFVKFNCPEFTSLCPKTGQPDFATIYISYIPDKKMVESKSLKLYLFSFRNHGDFHEDCMNTILDDLVSLMDPRYIEVWGKFTPVAAFQSILTLIMENQIPNGRHLLNNACFSMIFILKRLTIGKTEFILKEH